MNTRSQQWRAADLTPLGIGDKPADLSGRAAKVERIEQILSTAAGESYLMWRRLEAAADLMETSGIIEPAAVHSSDELHRLLEPRTQLAQSLATTMSTSRYAAEQLLDHAEAMRTRLPESGLLLRDGVISPRAFGSLVFETEAVIDPDRRRETDHRIAAALRESGNLAPKAVAELARQIVLAVDADGARAEREAATKSKGVQIYPGRGGMATLEYTDSAERVGLAFTAINAAANTPDDGDGRTKDQRRADTMFERLTATDPTGPGGRAVVRVITDGSTLDGGDLPGHLDGHGAISAQHVRDIAADPDTLIRDLDLTELTEHSAQAADPYRPTALLETVVRGLFGRCSWPGCHQPASTSDLDHVTEYDHHNPAAGGQTWLGNLNPKCRFHHLLKTFGDGWLDDQIIDANGDVWTEITTPEGFTTRTRAPNMWLFPHIGLIPHPPPADDSSATAPVSEPEPTRRTTRTENKHAYRRHLRAQGRAARPPKVVPTPRPDLNGDHRQRKDVLLRWVAQPSAIPAASAWGDDGPPPF